MPSIEELQAKYPQLWEKARKKFSSPQAQRKYFRALVEAQRARELEKEIRAKERSRDRRRRTRALILFALRVLENYSQNGKSDQIREALQKHPLLGKEGRQEVDYSPYILRILDELDNQPMRV